MKHFLYLFLILISTMAFAQDDMYFDPSTDYDLASNSYQNAQAQSEYAASPERTRNSSYDASDYDPRYYSRRLQRFHNAGPAFGAGDPFFSPGVQVFVGTAPGMGWNRWNSWNRWNQWNSWNSWNHWNTWGTWNSWNRWDRWNSPWNTWNSWNGWNSWGYNPWFYNDPFFCPPTPYYNNNWDNNASSRTRYYGPRYNTPVNDDFSKSRLRTTGNTDVNGRSNGGQPSQNDLRSRSAEQQYPSESRFQGQDRTPSNNRTMDRRNTQYSQDDFQRSYRGMNRTNDSYNRSYRNDLRTRDNSNRSFNRSRSSTPRSYQPRSNTRSSGTINRSSTRSRSSSTRSSGGSNLRRSGGN